jgi:hypothetical protein
LDGTVASPFPFSNRRGVSYFTGQKLLQPHTPFSYRAEQRFPSLNPDGKLVSGWVSVRQDDFALGFARLWRPWDA